MANGTVNTAKGLTNSALRGNLFHGVVTGITETGTGFDITLTGAAAGDVVVATALNAEGAKVNASLLVVAATNKITFTFASTALTAPKWNMMVYKADGLVRTGQNMHGVDMGDFNS